MAYLYTYTNTDKGEIFYIGIGSDLNYQRAKNIKARSSYFKRVIEKYNYRLDIVFDNLTWEEVCQKEIELISKYGRKDLNNGSLINFTNGGEGRLGSQNKITPIYQIDLNGIIVKEWLNTTIICENLKITKQALYATLNGKTLKCNKFLWCYTKRYSTEYIEEIINKINQDKIRRKSKCGKEHVPILQYDLNNNFLKEYKSIGEAARKTGTRSSCIVQCINSKYKRIKANNFIWKRKQI